MSEGEILEATARTGLVDMTTIPEGEQEALAAFVAGL